ncbi:hypothetical protein [Cohnella cholangitidis]|uniref:Uncharacterized protein n=1 Tax=Cohnella cholangitidis TaxID=2598458 RepID=A0A7G5BU65_9BACL|nr:hypothetical protein [Cohnella cholangitidis]QMV40499.1 hypothetical protein FPL14_04225 [Cohnella cholangitidis]
MGRNLGIVNMLAVVFIAALLVAYIVYVQKEKSEIEQLKLSYAIDYASDAGAMAMLETTNLDMDYTKGQFSFSVDPQLALDAFLDVFCFNYDMMPTEQNKALLKDFIPVAAVATNDGYYMATHQLVRNGGGNYPDNPGGEVNDGDWDLVFGMKMPYLYASGSDIYALNMGLKHSLKINNNSLTKPEGIPPGLTEVTARALMSNLVSEDMANSIDEMNETNPYWRNAFYIPSQLTKNSGVNPIEGPSFLVLVQGVNLTTSRPISGFSVSGTKIVGARMVIGYKPGGVPLYAYADKVDEGTVTVVDLFTSIEEAAEAGYYMDLEVMK